MSESTTAASTGSLIYAVPDNLIHIILQHLSATDLCHVASCSRWLRDLANQDSLWRPLCQSRGWEHYGTTTDLAKIPSYGPSEHAGDANGAGEDSVTFRKDRIVTDDNTGGLTGTCRWKGVYMRAYHLDGNWAGNCSHFKGFYLDVEIKRGTDPNSPRICVDGDLLAFRNFGQAIQVYNIRKKALQCVVSPPIESEYFLWLMKRMFKFKDGVIVVPGIGVAHAFDGMSGKLLQTINGNWGRSDVSLFFDGELIITYVYASKRENSEKFRDIFVWCVKDGQLQHILTVDPKNCVCVRYNVDYRDKMVAAAYDDDYIRVWDARSGECLHKLHCPGEKSDVKLGDNIIVGFSYSFDKKVCDIIIWSQNTGECQKVIREIPSRLQSPRIPQVVNNLILVHDRADHLNRIDDCIDFLYVYNPRRNLVTEMVNHWDFVRRNGSKCVYMVVDQIIKWVGREGKRVVFNATPNGLVRLFDVGLTIIIWIDDIRMILYDDKERRLLFHHFW